MNNIHNFANLKLCEYASIFPTVESLLGHLLFVIGNGYQFDSGSGMLADEFNKKINQYPALTQSQCDQLIAQCHQKVRDFEEKFSRNGDIDEEYIAKECSQYRVHDVTDRDFSTESLLADLHSRSEMHNRERGNFSGIYYCRPYPLSEKYSRIFHLNSNTPTWFLQIARNLCDAWVQFLNHEIETNNLWIPHSQRAPRILSEEEKIQAQGMAELFAEIKKDSDYDGWLDQPRPTRDYGDLEWTTMHRDMLQSQVERLQKLIESKS